MATICDTKDAYLNFIKSNRTKNTYRTYSLGMELFIETLTEHGINPSVTSVSLVTEEWIKLLFEKILGFAPSTVYVFLFAIKGWYLYISDFYGVKINTNKLVNIIRSGRPKLVHFKNMKPRLHDVSKIIDYFVNKDEKDFTEPKEKLNFLRAKALVFTLADTGVNLETLCGLHVDDINFKKSLFQIGKGNGANSIGVSNRALQSIKDYMEIRMKVDNIRVHNPNSLPLFMRHDNKKDKELYPLASRSVNKIIKEWAYLILGVDVAQSEISPISFRYYYEANLSQPILALLHPKIIEKCRSLFEDGYYDSAMFNAMKVIEEEIRRKSKSLPTDIGAKLITKAMSVESSTIIFNVNSG